MSKKTVLIIHPAQFGYHTDSFEMALYLSEEFDVRFLCFDSGQPRISSGTVHVDYVSSKESYPVRTRNFIKKCADLLRAEHELIFMSYFRFCSVISMLTNMKVVLDFRTASVHPNSFRRLIDDSLRRFAVLWFDRITVISEGLRESLHIPKSKAYILPLGSNVLSASLKIYDNPRLVYIGTFNNRRIHETVTGLGLFLKKFPAYREKISYDIVGYGYRDEELEIRKAIDQFGLAKQVNLHGRMQHNEMVPLLDRNNIGISYVPMTDYFDVQPATKTYEYVLSGLVCLATATSENQKCIIPENGVLHEDTPQSFAAALETAVERFSSYTDPEIRRTLQGFTWRKILDKFSKEFIHAG